MTQDMKTILTRLFTVALLMMVSLGAMADVKVLFGEKGDDKVKTDGDKIEATYDGGTIVVTQKVVDATKVTVFLTVTPNKGYTMQEKNVIEAYATAPANIGTTRAPLVSEKLTLDCEDFKDETLKRTYTTTIDSKLALWVKSAKFESASKGGSTRATNYKYVIINNKGNKAFNYTIRGDINYTSINKEQLCVHPKAKSVLATNFRFYTTEHAAKADASSGVTGTEGTDYYTEGTTISGIEGVTDNTFYVRYSLKDNPAIDINAEKAYKMQVRDRSNKWYYIVYDGSANKIKMVTAEGTTSSYLWKFDSGDPYDMYILNLQGLADNANGVFTVPNVVNTGDSNGESTLSEIYYRDKITSNYNQSVSGISLQSFILTQGSDKGFNYETGWKSVWSSSFQIIGAYNAIENKPQDTGGTGNTYATPLNMAYYVCANTAGDGKPLQFYRNWRVEDTKSTNVSQIKFTEVKQTYTFHIINNSGAEAVKARTASELNAGATITESMIPDILKSPVATNYTFYPTLADAAEGSNALTRLPYPSQDVYVRYTTNGGSLNLTGGTNYYVLTNGNYLYASSSSAIEIESSITSTDNTRKWIITGNDAYQLILQNAGNSNYVTYNVSSGEAVPTLSASGSKFFLHQSTNGKYELVAVTTNDFSTTDYYTLGVANNTLKLYSKTNYPLGNDAVQTFFSDHDFCAKPVISFDNSNNQITIDCATAGASIYYTDDGTPPTSSSTLYTGAFTVSDGTTIKAIATKAESDDSEVASLTIVLTPTITLEGMPCTYDGTAKEPVSSVKVGETIIDPSEYTVSYSNNINVGSTATVTITDNEGGDYYVAGDITFTIDPLSIGSGTTPATGISIDVSMSGSNYVVTVKHGNTTLTEGTDYSWEGGPEVTVTGMGNYTGTAKALYVPVTPGYYALHQNGKGYLKVSGAGVNLENDGTFQSGNLFDKGNCIWYMTPEGYLQNEYFYLNAANNNTLYLSVNPVTRWRSEDVTGENTYGKKHLKINNGTEDLYLCNDNNSITLKNNPSAYYSACPVDVEEVENSWAGPTAENLTVQSPQLVTYLRAYFTQKIKYTFHNDAGAEVKSTDGKHERRVYATIAYKEGGNNKGTDWDIDESGILYNKKASGDVEFTATYNILPADPVALSAHSTAATKDIKYKVTQKPLAPTAGTDYLLYSISGGDSYRYPYDDGVTDGGPVKPDGKGGTGNTSVLTDPDTNKNLQISWKITVDAEGFYTFQNSSTNKYLYYDDTPHASSDYGTLSVSANPSGNSAKFRLYKAANDANYGTCYYIIPYSKIFAVYKSDGLANGLYTALNIKDYRGENPVISLSKPSTNSTWRIYKYEAEYRVRTDFVISGNSFTSETGNQIFNSEGWYGKYIKDSPKTGDGQRGLVIQGTYDTNVEYAWTVEDLSDYSYVGAEGIHTFTGTGDAGKTLTLNVNSLPVSSTSGVIKLKITGSTGSSSNVRSGEKTFAFTILGDGTVTLTDIKSLALITESNGAYRLVGGEGSNFAYSATNKPGVTSFSGILDGNNQTISGLSAPLFDNMSNGTVRNVNLSGVSISSHSGPTGAIAGTADGGSRIYNVGILDGEVGSSDDVCGGLVGKLDGSARVINCFSYAKITGGTNVGGIVGNNTYASKSNDARTMVMNCMFYGDITGGSSKAPIYNGEIITNRSDQNGVGNFNYFWAGASYVIDAYNCALAAETRFLNRFEFYRHLLNSNRALAAWWATGDYNNKDEMMKWVMEPSQIGSDTTPYPILKAPDRYPSVVNIDVNHSETYKGQDLTVGDKLGTLTVNIQMGSNGDGDTHPVGAEIIEAKKQLTLHVFDKDPTHFNFNYYKVQLPYYNDVGTNNYRKDAGGVSRVVTGWKIVDISGGTHSFSTGSDATASVSTKEETKGDITLTTPYNFADRKSTQKDLYGEGGSNRIFNQGAYFDVPEGVTSITIEPYWAKCVYVADAYPDVVYDQTMTTASDVTTVGTINGNARYTNGQSYPINNESQVVYTSMSNAAGQMPTSGKVYDNAIVLVGNVHSLGLSNETDSKEYTIMSIDLDKDNEPDYSYILRFNDRKRVHPVRVDFLNVIGLGMAQKSTGGQGTYNLGIMQPLGWFECTNTGLFRVTQFEYDRNPRKSAPMILHGGVIEQWVTVAETSGNVTEANAVDYYHVGSNVWFKEFHIGAHQDRQQIISPHPPISVTGGDYDAFYLTGMYNTPNSNYEDNAECYINGGRFGKMAGTGMQGLGKAGGAGVTGGPAETGNIIWQIDNADIDEFYAGGINAAHIATGNIYTVITNSRVDQFCGGPKFGNMNSDKKVVTNATNCTFRTFFGAGYGGNSYNREYPTNKYNDYNYSWNSWLASVYKNEFKSNFKGVSTRIDYQFIPKSDNTLNVARLFVDYVSFSLATTHDVTSKLTDCTITTSPLGRLKLFAQCLGNFYGGGSLGKVTGDVKSTLTNCTVEGNVFGGGYSATLPTVDVMANSFQRVPSYNTNTGAYTEAILPTTEPYTWEHRDVVNTTETAIDTGKKILYTQEDLTGLGAVTGNVTLTIDGNTTLTDGKVMSVTKSVYGGGEESNVEGNTQVNITGGTITQNVFGGGKGEADEFLCSKAMVGRNDDGRCEDPGSDTNKDKGTKVTISNGTVNGNVYGGGEVGRVEWNTQVTIGNTSGEGTPIINGNVFGAGKGKETHGYAALVRGNSSVTIQGNAKVRENVYGGGEQATVGRYWVKNVPTTLCENDENEKVIPTPPGDLPDEMPYKTRRGGKSTVIVQGSAQIGPDDGATSTAGHVFGAGKGVTPTYVHEGDKANWSKRMVDYNSDKHTGEPGTTWDYYPDDHNYVWEYFATEAKYLEFLQTLALVTGTEVTISGATVKGNVYGGSESGFVQDDTDVKIQSGTIGTADSYGYVFGGGKGLPQFSEAGLVKGNASVEVSDGTIQRNVYGGGELGHVGTFTETDDGRYIKKKDINGVDMNTGLCTVSVTGGKIGPDNNSDQEIGNVFGAGKGKDDTFKCEKAMTMETSVSVCGGTVNGNVYGGGEVGRVEYDTEVTIGRKSNETAGSGTGKPIINGSVFGAGRGVATHGYSALVRGNTRVDVEGAAGAMVKGDVFGGGEIASVGRYGLNAENMPNILLGGGGCVVNVQGSVVITGNVFGAGQGVDPSTFNKTGSDKTKLSRRMTVYTNSSEFKDDHTTETGTWELYDGSVTPNIIWEYYQNEGAYSDYLQTLALATAPNVTIDGNAKVKGSVFGGGELGLTKGSVTVTIQNGTIGTLDTSGNPVVGTGDVYGGGSLANTNTTHYVGLKNADESPKYAEEEVDGKTIKYIETKEVHPTTIVRLIGGEVYGDAYGGGLGRLASDDVSAVQAVVVGDVLVDLNGETTVTTGEDGGRSWTDNTGATNSGTTITGKGCIVNRIFGCNNLNGTPQKNVTVHVYATQNKKKSTVAEKYRLENESLDKLNITETTIETDDAYKTRLKAILADKIEFAEELGLTVSDDDKSLSTSSSATADALKTAITNVTTEINTKTTDEINGIRYDVEAVYGGGNVAAYVPVYNTTTGATEFKTQVLIEGCDYTSIETVYGGGNAAAVPETNVDIKGAYEIGYLFGGGNGKDDIAPGVENPGADVGTLDHGTTTYGTGNANTLMEAGLIHEVYGGSNTKGIIKGAINQITAPKDPEDEDFCCELEVDKIVGAGKYADIDGDVNMTLSCQPSSKVPLLFAGADEANVNGNITLTITNGNFGKVFGGNNLGGAVKGKITVNVKETGCQPIKIDELYLGGNEAAYSVFGYYESNETHEVTGKKILKPRTAEMHAITDPTAEGYKAPVTNPTTDATHTFPYAQPELNIISCTYIGKVFGGGLGAPATMYANPSVNVNMVQGNHAATAVPAMMEELHLNVTKTAPNPHNLGIIGDVFGGGNAADIEGNTTVNIAVEYVVKQVNVGASVTGYYTRSGAGTTADPFVYTAATGTAEEGTTYYEKGSAYIIGSVFGGGNAADVLGNTNVTMSDGYVFNGIFGGGYAGNVGTFTRSTDAQYTNVFGHTAHEGVCIGKPISCAEGTGKCTVLVNGGQIGPISVATEGMNRPKAQGGPVPEGWVWGAGQGLVEDPATHPDTHFKSYVGSTDVTIGGTAFVLESVIGGGEFGRVLYDTKVTITGNCQIGVGEGMVDDDGKPIRYTDDQFVNPLTTTITSGENGNALAECSHFPYGEDTNNDGIKDKFLPYDLYYDKYLAKNSSLATSDLGPASTASPSDGKTWIGCVFAGGSGYMPYEKDDGSGYDWCSSAGLVEGNTNLTISGGHILTNVYGGNEVTNVKGTCKVTMTGGTIGVPRTVQQIIDHPLTCYLFGAGKGDPRPHFNTETNVKDVEIDISGGIIYGSVFGGGEDGHVQRNVTMTIGKDDHTGPIIGTWGTTYVDGNIFGGGRGFAGDAYTAGNVAGCVDLDIKGGNILGSIYGGGRLGSVGYGLYPSTEDDTKYGAMRPDNTGDDGSKATIPGFKRGYVDVEISGGTIGNDYEYIIPSADNTPTGLTFDNIASWTDANWKTWKTHNNIPLTEFDKVTESDKVTYRLKHTKGGNVFAGGMGRLYQLDGKTPISAVNWWKVGCVKQTKLTVKGGIIKSNVYGGGELGAVKPYVNGTVVQGGTTEVIVQNDNTQIGTEVQDGDNVIQYTFGSVYGGGYGSTIENLNGTDDPNTENDNPKFVAGLVHGNTKIDMQGGKVLASIYGGGEVASVNGSADVAVSGGIVGKDKVGTKQFGGPTMGNVYGGGSGHPNIVRCGRILKNTKITISGDDTKIYHNVYGGGAYGTVGEFNYKTDPNDHKVTGVESLKTANTGKAEIIITGGTIGVDGNENGMVFGSSRGDVNRPGERDDHTAWVYDADVTIGETNGSTNTPLIKGSVYGSGENGHTFHNTYVKVHSGTIGIDDENDNGYTITGSSGIVYKGAAYPYRGNVYGGGCGTDTYKVADKKYFNPLAGIVLGNAKVEMDGGHVVRTIYGGGAMGSVGTFTYDNDANNDIPDGKPISCLEGTAATETTQATEGTGLCTVTISGGKIGPETMAMPNSYGNVFGAGRGEVHAPADYPNLETSAYFNRTEVTINGTAFVKGSVYGGAESGHVLKDTWVKIQGGQIGCGKNRNEPYSDNDWKSTSLDPCVSWDYEEDGLAYDPNASALVDGDWKYADRTTSTEGGAAVATDGHTFYGNVFGGGSGNIPYKDNNGVSQWVPSAGRVEGNTVVTITGGHILTNVYGGNECTDVLGSCTVNMSGGTVGVPRTKAEILQNPALGYLFGAGKGDKRVLFNTWTNVASTSVNVTGGTIYGSVYGGGEDGHVLGDAVTTIDQSSTEYPTVIGVTGESGYDGNVFGGGQGSTSALTAGVVGGNVNLYIKGGQMLGSVYGGGRLASVGTYFTDPNDSNYGSLWTEDLENHGYISVSLTGGTVTQNVFGGGMGTTDDKFGTAAGLGISRNVTVDLNKDVDNDAKGCVVDGSIFGCNNLNTSPRGTVTVHIHKTQNAEATTIANPSEGEKTAKVKGRFDVKAVYGGGNMAAYEPDALIKTGTDAEKEASKPAAKVIIDGCDLTSIRQVYGGGNAASTPATDVEVNGTYEIFELFGGGNGADRLPDGSPNPGANVGYKDYHEVENDPRFATKEARVDGDAFAEYRYGTGVATVNVKGGTIHRVFGGSNTKGNVRKTALTLLEESTGCPFCVDEAYGGGKSAPMDAEAQLHMACIPGLKEAYGGAEAADIQGDVTLTITNGTFNRVFGGNNISGTIRGSITVNVEETGCKPIIIGELYGGGNQAGYSVRGYKKVTEGTSEVWKPRMPEDDLEADMNGNTFHDPQVNIKSFTSIGEVYGGGYGEGAVMVGSPKVSVNEAIGTPGTYPTTGDDFDETGFKGKTFTFDEGMATEHTVTCPSHVKGKMGAINNVFGGGNAAKVVGDTYVNIGTLDKVIFETPAEASQEARTKTVMGADIRGNVYGGGNEAEVTGGTNVTIGKEKVTTP